MASLRCWCGVRDDRPLFVGGLTAAGDAWMLGTPEIADAKRFYVAAMRQMVAEMAAMVPVITARVDVRYVRSLRLMARLGFELGEPFAFAGRMVCPAERKSTR